MLSIDGAPTEGWDGDRAAKSLRGRQGSSVMVKFARRSSQVPGVAGRPEQAPRVEFTQVLALPLRCRANRAAGAALPCQRANVLLSCSTIRQFYAIKGAHAWLGKAMAADGQRQAPCLCIGGAGHPAPVCCRCSCGASR